MEFLDRRGSVSPVFYQVSLDFKSQYSKFIYLNIRLNTRLEYTEGVEFGMNFERTERRIKKQPFHTYL